MTLIGVHSTTHLTHYVLKYIQLTFDKSAEIRFAPHAEHSSGVVVTDGLPVKPMNRF